MERLSDGGVLKMCCQRSQILRDQLALADQSKGFFVVLLRSDSLFNSLVTPALDLNIPSNADMKAIDHFTQTSRIHILALLTSMHSPQALHSPCTAGSSPPLHIRMLSSCQHKSHTC